VTRLARFRRPPWLIALVLVLVGCAGHTKILPNPPEASVQLDGMALPGNTLRYGRWVGNAYHLEVAAPGFETQRLEVSPALGNRAIAVALFCTGTVVGIPLIPVLVLWNGELDDRIYVSLTPLQP